MSTPDCRAISVTGKGSGGGLQLDAAALQAVRREGRVQSSLRKENTESMSKRLRRQGARHGGCGRIRQERTGWGRAVQRVGGQAAGTQV